MNEAKSVDYSKTTKPSYVPIEAWKVFILAFKKDPYFNLFEELYYKILFHEDAQDIWKIWNTYHSNIDSALFIKSICVAQSQAITKKEIKKGLANEMKGWNKSPPEDIKSRIESKVFQLINLLNECQYLGKEITIDDNKHFISLSDYCQLNNIIENLNNLKN